MTRKDSNKNTTMNCPLLVILLFSAVVCGCVVGKPVTYNVPGAQETHTTTTLLGIPVSTKVRLSESPEATKLRLAREKAEQEQARKLEQAGLKLRQQKRQGDAAHYMGLGLFVGAILCVILGCLQNGWKTWGTLAIVLGGLGALSWGVAQSVPYLRWVVVPVVAAGVLRLMYSVRDFSAANWVRGWVQNKKTQEKAPGNG